MTDPRRAERLGIHEFGRRLIKTGDLDPVYIGFLGLPIDYDLRRRWLLAYWCFYHVGVASWLAEQPPDQFWPRLREAAVNATPSPAGGRWLRSPERRHFRGDKCVRAVDWLAQATPRQRIGDLCRAIPGTLNLDAVLRNMEDWPLFGPWIGFKAADMIDRCLGEKVYFPADVGYMYREPRAALDLLVAEDQSTDAQGHWERLLEHFRQYLAPPILDRPCGVQEVETVCCKWKSHMHGGYWIGKDTVEVRHATAGWGDLAQDFAAALPPQEDASALRDRLRW